jgi:hypothetical protein
MFFNILRAIHPTCPAYFAGFVTPLQKGLSQSRQGRKEEKYMKKPFADFAPLREIFGFFQWTHSCHSSIREIRVEKLLPCESPAVNRLFTFGLSVYTLVRYTS